VQAQLSEEKMKCPCGGKLLYFGVVTSLVVVYRCTECGRDTYKSYGEKPVHEGQR
jgi:DNA-directed RNA polymerase subunit RPC12/RpoP